MSVPPPNLDDRPPRTSSSERRRVSAAVDDLVRRLAEEMASAWAAGERPLAEAYLTRHPELAQTPDAAAELIYEEVSLREQHGERISTEVLLRRFPEWQAPLATMLECRRLFEPLAPPEFPAPGEVFGEFHLLAELGRGRGGVVYLATQPQLADRPVALKVTPCDGNEHLRLARLQHTHIVPLYSAQDDAVRGLRVLCMPYFGGTSLSRLLSLLKRQPPAQRTGKDILAALDHLQAAGPLPLAARGPARLLLERASYVQAVCWIGNRLADALQYAHEHGLVHLDLKPSNVLVTAEGQPMLLDFHLAREPLTAGCVESDGLGGTPDYMSPEQRRALAAVSEGKPLPTAVDARSDVFSLGVLLHELLADVRPTTEGIASCLRSSHPGVSAGLAALVARCLAADAKDRYPDAAAVAADLQRHLTDQPLQGVPNHSVVERWQKWRRRRPYLLPLAFTLGIVLLVSITLIAGYFGQRIEAARAALTEGQARMQERRHAEAVNCLQSGLGQLEHVPFHEDLRAAVRDQLLRATQALEIEERAAIVAELNQLAERVRWQGASETLPVTSQRALERACRSFWERRGQVLERLHSATPSQWLSVRQDLLDLALFWTDLRVVLAGPDMKDHVRRECLQVMAELEELCGPSPVLYFHRERYATAAGLEEVARRARQRLAALPASTAWEHVTLGRSLLEAGHTRQAAVHFDRALALQPEQLWAHFFRGLCCYRLEEYEDAVVAFSVCIGLAPDQAACYCNRAGAFSNCGQTDRALRDYRRALELNPSLAVAFLHRGRLYARQKQWPQALADLRRALELGSDPVITHHEIARVQLVQGDRAGALASVRAILQLDAANASALELQDTLTRDR